MTANITLVKYPDNDAQVLVPIPSNEAFRLAVQIILLVDGALIKATDGHSIVWDTNSRFCKAYLEQLGMRNQP